jgi:GxxExxY protein
VYEEALSCELELRGLRFVRQYGVALSYKGRAIGEGRLDLLEENQLIVELKARGFSLADSLSTSAVLFKNDRAPFRSVD